MANESYTFQIEATVTYEVTIVGLDDEDEGMMVISDEFREIQDLANDDRAVLVAPHRIEVRGVRSNN